MRHLQQAWVAGRFLLSTLVGWLVAGGIAWAQMPKATSNSEGGSYVVSYTIVILLVGIGLMLVCRVSQRSERARPEQYDASKRGLKE